MVSISLNMFQIGNKVKVIDDNQSGTVVGIRKSQIIILNEFGFEESFHPNELIPDEKLEIGKIEILPTENSSRKSEKNPLSEVKEIDLHIGQLVDSFIHLTHYDMLQIQLQKIEEEIELARAERRSRLIFIHGHGSGKLKEEMMKLLNRYKGLEVYDASFRKYKLGATEVKLR